MTLEIGFLFLMLAGMVYLFMTEKLPVDLTAFLGLVILVFAGFVAPEEAFSGFASSAVITMLSIFILSGALLYTGVADMVGRWVHRWVGSREVPLIVTIMIVAGILSAFMNNIAATAVIMPAVASIARRARLSPSRLFMPLSFGAILGGTTTLVGTPPNILAAELLQQRGLEPFGLFDFSPIGLTLLAAGVIFMVTVGRHLLPERDHGPAATESQELAAVYQLRERFFSLHIPGDSPLEGMTLGESRLGTALGVKVVAIVRSGKKQLAPRPESVLRRGDTLLVEGSREDLEELLRVQGVEVEQARAGELPRPARGVTGVRGVLREGSRLVGHSLRDLHFREKFGVVVVAIERHGEMLRDQLGQVVLQVGDEILALGPRKQLRGFSGDENFDQVKVGLSAMAQLQAHLFLINIPDGSPLAGTTVRSSRIGELAGVTVGGIIREGRMRLAVPTDEVIRAGDRLLVAGEPEGVTRLLNIGHVGLDSNVVAPVLESEGIGLAEVALAPRSGLLGKTLREINFRERYGLQVLAVWRGGRPIHKHLVDLTLEFGDALLVQGPRDKLRQLVSDIDFVALSEIGKTPRRTERAPWALACLGLMVAVVMLGWQPIHVAAFAAATLAVFSGALRMDEAYRVVEWKAIFLVAAVLPVGIAMERTGAAMLLASTVTDVAGPWGNYAVLTAMVGLSSLLSQGLDGAPAVVLLTPVVIQAAEGLNMSPYPIMMGVSLAASAAFMTPFSHKANLLVMGAGGYRAMDYLKVGTPLTVVVFLVLVVMVPWFYPF